MIEFGLPAVLMGTAAIISIQPQIAVSLSPAEVATIAEEITVFIQVPGGSGSGVIVNSQGNTYLVLTAGHVVANIKSGEEADLTTHDGQIHGINTDRISNLPGVDLSIVEFTSNGSYLSANIGNSDEAGNLTTVFVAGFPYSGQAIKQDFFIIPGAIVNRNSSNNDGYELVYNNNTREGMSGGPILNEQGQVIGIHGRAEGTEIQGERVKAGFNLGIPIKTFVQLASRAGVNLDSSVATSSPPPPPPTTTPTPTPSPNNRPARLEQPTNLPLIAAARGVDKNTMYTRLARFLAAGEWRNADQQTWELMKQVGDRNVSGGLSESEIRDFSCPDLRQIDNLWVKFSNGRFGFSTQKDIYERLGGRYGDVPDIQQYRRFAIQVGWKEGDDTTGTGYYNYNDLQFSSQAPTGHLPTHTVGLISYLSRNGCL